MNLKLIKMLCQMTEENLHKNLIKLLEETPAYQTIRYTDSYIIAEGQLPVCLIAHLDTVFKELPQEFLYDPKKKVLWSPYGSGFDDRAGVYLIIQLIKEGLYPSIIFTRGEEIGGIGARELVHDYPDCPFQDCRAIIQLDRAYEDDAVFYDCNNKDFEKYICRYGFKFQWGTFTDISIIAPDWKIAAVNLSVGYMSEHTSSERLYCECTDDTLRKVRKILKDSEKMPSFSYIPYKAPKYQNYFAGYIFDDDNCLICNNKIKTGRHIFEGYGQGYNVCDECFAQYYDPLTTTSSIIHKGVEAEQPPF